MNKIGLLNALLGFIITLGTAFITLLSGDDVQAFNDVSAVEYTVAVIGSLVGALTTYKAKMSESPDA